jgi:putative ABC transport system substrate-binding protein
MALALRPTLVLALLAAPLAAGAQSAKVPRIGVLIVMPPVNTKSFQEEFRAGLRERGYVEGQNILVDYQVVDERVDRLPHLASELVRLKVDIIVASTTLAVLAAKGATSEIPIVMFEAGGPLGPGWWPASPGQAETSQDCLPNLPSSVESAWSSSARSCPR